MLTTHLLQDTMAACTASRQWLHRSASVLTAGPIETTLPAFLVPALTSPSKWPSRQSSHFSTTSQRRSKIGRAPITLPPEVTLHIMQPPAPKDTSRVSRTQAGSNISIEGPRGKMSLSIPAYMSLSTDETGRTNSLSILDAEDRKQREMWGM